MKKSWLAALAICFAGAATAAQQAYHGQGSLVPFGNPLDYQTYGYMEVWGQGSNARCANPATDTGDIFHYLINASDAASAAALGGYTGASSCFGYDAAAAPYFVSASGNLARYAIGPVGVELTGAGLSPQGLSAADTAMSVIRSTSGHTQLVTFTRTAPTVDGAVPGSSFAYTAPLATVFPVDLVSLLGPTAYFSSGFDLSAFSTLPVRLSTPTPFVPVGYVVQFVRNDPAVNFGTTPPGSLSLVDWNSATIAVYFDGLYGIAVNADDFASNDAYLAASSWVDTNIRQINFEQSLTYNITNLAPVPEMPTAGLGHVVQDGQVVGARAPLSVSACAVRRGWRGREAQGASVMPSTNCIGTAATAGLDPPEA